MLRREQFLKVFHGHTIVHQKQRIWIFDDLLSKPLQMLKGFLCDVRTKKATEFIRVIKKDTRNPTHSHFFGHLGHWTHSLPDLPCMLPFPLNNPSCENERLVEAPTATLAGCSTAEIKFLDCCGTPRLALCPWRLGMFAASKNSTNLRDQHHFIVVSRHRLSSTFARLFQKATNARTLKKKSPTWPFQCLERKSMHPYFSLRVPTPMSPPPNKTWIRLGMNILGIHWNQTVGSEMPKGTTQQVERQKTWRVRTNEFCDRKFCNEL